MSRSGYSDDCDNWDLIRWRGAVKSAIRGERGQRLLRDLRDALDRLPRKELIADEFRVEGQFCALGAVAALRHMDFDRLDSGMDPEDVAREFGIAHALAAEIMAINDDTFGDHDYVQVEIEGPMRPYHPDWGQHRRTVWVPNPDALERRFNRVRAWVRDNLKE